MLKFQGCFICDNVDKIKKIIEDTKDKESFLQFLSRTKNQDFLRYLKDKCEFKINEMPIDYLIQHFRSIHNLELKNILKLDLIIYEYIFACVYKIDFSRSIQYILIL